MIDFGLDANEFVRQYLDRKPYVRTAATSQRFAWRNLDQVLSVAEIDGSAIQLFLNGQLPPQAFSEDSMEFGRRITRLNKHRFYDLLQRGATLVINQIEKYSLEARRLGLAVSRFTGMQTTSNAYVSFGGDGTFGKHWDTHDVVVLQLQGRKHWQIFAPSWPMPLSHQTSERMQTTCPAQPEFEVTLETGDLLYIPRGWWHNVTPLNEGSFHLSVGLYAPTLTDYVTWLCSRYLPQHLNARQLVNAATLQSLPELMNVVKTAAQDKNNYTTFVKEMRQRDRLISEFNTELFAKSGNATLASDALLMLTTYGEFDTDTGEMRINGGRIKLDSLGRAIVKILDEQLCMSFGELCTQLPGTAPATVAAAALGLARHELINISLPSLPHPDR